MDNMIIQLHSIVDVITNSSTVIYTGVNDNAVEMVEAIINDVLAQLPLQRYEPGGGFEAKDLYDIEIVRRRFDEDEGDYIDPEEQVDGDILNCLEMAVYTDSAIKVTSKTTGDTVVSDALGSIFKLDAPDDY